MPQYFTGKAIYIAAAEIVISMATCLNYEVLLKHLFNQIGRGVPIETVLVLGSIHAIISSLAVDANWTVVILIFHVAYAACVIIADFRDAAFYGALALSTLASTLFPARLAYVADQVPKSSQSKSYFAFIVWMQFASRIAFWGFTELNARPVIVFRSGLVFFSLTAAYLAVILVLEFRSIRSLKAPWKMLLPVSLQTYDEVVTSMPLMRIALSLSGHYFARMVAEKTMIPHYKSIPFQDSVTNNAVIVVIGLPNLLALVIIPAIRCTKLNRILNDLSLIGMGMLCSCGALVCTAYIQGLVEESIHVPQKHETLITIFNALPSNSNLFSQSFGLSDGEWLELQPFSSIEFLAAGVVGTERFPVTVINLNSEAWDETLLSVEEGVSFVCICYHVGAVALAEPQKDVYTGTSTSFIIANGKFTEVAGLQLDGGSDPKKSEVYLKCLIAHCSWTITFEGENYHKKVELRNTEDFMRTQLCGSRYVIHRSGGQNSNYVLLSQFEVTPPDVYTLVIEELDGIAEAKVFRKRQGSRLTYLTFFFHQLLAVLSECLLQLGLLHFLFDVSDNFRYSTYAHFFFLAQGIPWIILGLLQINIVNYVESSVVFLALLYNICTLCLFATLAISYKRN